MRATWRTARCRWGRGQSQLRSTVRSWYLLAGL